MLMTNDMYKKTFCADPLSFGACTPPDKPWFVAFVAFKRSDEQFWQSAFVTNTMKVLAEQYKGEVQFAVVNSHKSEMMRSTFGVRSLPAEFFYKDGQWYEQSFMQILVNNIRTFIDERHLNEEIRYQVFETPYLIPKFAMPVKRKYN